MHAGPNPKRNTYLKWPILILSMFSGFAFAYSYDTPAAIKMSLQTLLSGQFTEEQFEIRYSLLYSVMALPNIFTSLFIGYSLDKFGPNANFLVMAILLALGTTVTSFGVAGLSFAAICIGRFIQGVTGQPVHIVESRFLKQYFNTKRMGFIITIIQALSSLGGFLTFVISPRYALDNAAAAFDITSYIAITNAVFIFGVCVIDKLIDWKSPRSLALSYEEEREALSAEGRGKRDDQSDSDQAAPEDSQSNAKPSYLSDALSFPMTYWYLLMAAVTTISSIKTFIMISSSYMVEKAGATGDLSQTLIIASQTVSIYRLTSSVAIIFVEYLLNWAGKRAFWLFMATVTVGITHVLMIFIPPIFCFVLYGLCYAIISATIWPLVVSLIPKRCMGLAVGLIDSIENIGLFVYPIVNGVIKAKTGTYDYSMVFLTILAILASLSGLKSYNLLRSEPEPRADPHRLTGPSIAVA